MMAKKDLQEILFVELGLQVPFVYECVVRLGQGGEGEPTETKNWNPENPGIPDKIPEIPESKIPEIPERPGSRIPDGGMAYPASAGELLRCIGPKASGSGVDRRSRWGPRCWMMCALLVFLPW